MICRIQNGGQEVLKDDISQLHSRLSKIICDTAVNKNGKSNQFFQIELCFLGGIMTRTDDMYPSLI